MDDLLVPLSALAIRALPADLGTARSEDKRTPEDHHQVKQVFDYKVAFRLARAGP